MSDLKAFLFSGLVGVIATILICGALFWFEDPRICERASNARSEIMACQALPNCRASLEDLRRAMRLHVRCEDYKK